MQSTSCCTTFDPCGDPEMVQALNRPGVIPQESGSTPELVPGFQAPHQGCYSSAIPSTDRSGLSLERCFWPEHRRDSP